MLVLDEPTAALDYGNEVHILSVLRELAAAGRTVLMSTHQPNHALSYASRAVLLRDGRVIADGPPEHVITSERLTDLYRVPIHVAPVHLGEVEVHVCVPIPTSDTRTTSTLSPAAPGAAPAGEAAPTGGWSGCPPSS